MKKILTIDDEVKICQLIKEYGEEFADYEVDYALNSSEALELLSMNKYDTITLDIQLGGEDGFELIQKINKSCTTPVIFVSALKASDIVVNGLELGADDYVKKPFDLKELFLRIDRSVKLNELQNGESVLFEFAGYVIDEIKGEVFKDGEKLEISGMPYKILVFFLKNPNRVMSRNEIYAELWEAEYGFNSRVIDAHIKKIRNKTMDSRIRSVRGIGYKFEIKQ